MCYAPIVLYVYAYVICDSMYNKTDSNMTKWLTYSLHDSIDNYLTFMIVQFQTAIWGTPLPPYRNVCLYAWHVGYVSAKPVFNTAEIFEIMQIIRR